MDQAIIKSAISDSSASTLAFLSSMGQREAIVFGEGVATTMRLKFERLDLSRIPGRKNQESGARGVTDGNIDLAGIVNRLRNVQSPQTQQPQVLPGASTSKLKQAGEADFRRPLQHPSTEAEPGFAANAGGRFGNRFRQD